MELGTPVIALVGDAEDHQQEQRRANDFRAERRRRTHQRPGAFRQRLPAGIWKIFSIDHRARFAAQCAAHDVVGFFKCHHRSAEQEMEHSRRGERAAELREDVGDDPAFGEIRPRRHAHRYCGVQVCAA